MSRHVMPLPWLLLVMMSAASIQYGYADRLALTFKRDNQSLDIRCSFQGDLHNTISHVTSLVMSRVKGDTEEVLTTAYCFHDDKENLLGATKTSKISSNKASESFINLHWDKATKYLDGVYTCELYGFDEHYNQVKLNESRTLIIPDNPSLEVKLMVVREGRLRNMELNCSVTNDSSINIKQVVSINIKATREGVGSVLGSVDIFGGSEVAYTSENAHVTSKLGDSSNFLALSWNRQLTSLSGRYFCEINGLDSKKQPVHFVKFIDVQAKHTENSVDDLISRIYALEDRNDELLSQNGELSSQNGELSSQNDELYSMIEHNNKTIEALQETVKFLESPPQSCSDFNYTSGRYPSTLLINYKKVNVICEVESTGIVWTIFHRRFNGSVGFYRNFKDYENGFGSVNGEFWMGLMHLKHLIGSRNHYLRLSLTDFDGSHEINYPTFGLSDGPEYTLRVDGNEDTKGLKYNNGNDFSAFDYGPKKNCAVDSDRSSGWWFDSCTYSNLNGIYGKTGDKGMVWYSLKGTKNHALTGAEMKIRPA